MAIQRDESGKILPGSVLNPNGRPPKAWTMSSLIEQALEEVEVETGQTFKQLVAKRLAHMAIAGDIQAIKEINDRMDGKPRQTTDITSGGEGLVINILTGHANPTNTRPLPPHASPNRGDAEPISEIQDAGLAQKSTKDNDPH